MQQLSIDERIERLEKAENAIDGRMHIPGTWISRQMKPFPESGCRWSLGLGRIDARRIEYFGDTIEDCLFQAEKEFRLVL